MSAPRQSVSLNCNRGKNRADLLAGRTASSRAPLHRDPVRTTYVPPQGCSNRPVNTKEYCTDHLAPVGPRGANRTARIHWGRLKAASGRASGVCE